MADTAVVAADAFCCIFCVQALQSWCFLRPYGSGTDTPRQCGGPRGFCGSCFDEDPDEDSFERAQRKERERLEKKEAQSQTEDDRHGRDGVVDRQPDPASAMQASSPKPYSPQ